MAQLFLPTPRMKSAPSYWGPTHPPSSLSKVCFFGEFGAKIPIPFAKIQMCGADNQSCIAKIQINQFLYKQKCPFPSRKVPFADRLTTPPLLLGISNKLQCNPLARRLFSGLTCKEFFWPKLVSQNWVGYNAMDVDLICRCEQVCIGEWIDM